MSEIIKVDLTTDSIPSVILDPFKSSKIEAIAIYVYKRGGKFDYSGRVEFKNGKTSGKQQIEGDSFESVVEQIRAIVDGLEDGK